MIRILFFIDTTLSSGGAEKVLRELVNHMDQTVFDITVHTVWPEDAEKYLTAGIRYRSVFSKKNEWNRARFRIETALGQTYKRHIKDDYDIEVAYLECAPTKIISASNNDHALKLAWVHCDLEKRTNDPEAFVKKSKKWYQKFDQVVCVSKAVRERFVELFGAKPESCILYNTVDDTAIRSKATDVSVQTGYREKMTVVTVGRMYHQKSYDRLLEAHWQLIQQGYDHDLWILGDGPDRPELERFVKEHSLESTVFMPGFQQNPYPYLSAADVVVCSSRYEGFSTVVTEALILGKCILTTDCSGMDELLGHSEYGLIVDNSTQGLYEGLKKLLSSQTLRQTYAQKALARGEDFSLTARVRQTEEFLLQSLQEKRNSEKHLQH